MNKGWDIMLLNSVVGKSTKAQSERLWNKLLRDKSLLKIPTSLEWGTYLSVSLAKKICVNIFADFLANPISSLKNLRHNSTRFLASKSNRAGFSTFVHRISDALKDHIEVDI